MNRLKRSLVGSQSRRHKNANSEFAGLLNGERFTSAFLIGTGAIGVAVLVVGLISGIRTLANPTIVASSSTTGYHLTAYNSATQITNTPLLSAATANNNQRVTSKDDTLASLFESGGEHNQCLVEKKQLSEADMRVARIAWKYFENNYNAETGLVNSVHGYPSTTMWDTGSALAAFLAARDFGFIGQKEFDDAIMKLMNSMQRIKLFDGKAPNKVYNTHTLEMVDYGNNAVEGGIGVSVLDLARLISWMDTLQCMHPQYHNPANSALSRWDYSELIQNDEMYGMAKDPLTGEILNLQEGRLGYEQYAGKIFDRAGFPVDTAMSYENKHRADTEILGVKIAHDARDPRIYHANNYVVTESYAMDAMELGTDSINTELLKNIFEVQKRRWKETGIVTAISEDNINQEPWFLYNTIFTSGLPFNTITETGAQHNNLKTVSTKAALSMAMLFPDDEYSKVLLATIGSAFDENLGWYSGVYENGGYNDVTTANTNGVILSVLLYKKYETLAKICEKCGTQLNIISDIRKQPTEDEADDEVALLCETCGPEE